MFSGEIDRAVFIAYFLGAIVPLIGLGVVVDRYVLPTLTHRNAEIALIAAVISTAALTFGSFLALRKMMRATVTRMNRDNERLSGLLEWSKQLGATPHVTDVLGAATVRAYEMEEARAAWVFLKGDEDDAPTLSGSAGNEADPLYTRHAGAIDELVTDAVDSGRPTMRETSDGEMAVAVVPLPAEAGLRGAIATLKTGHAHFDPRELEALETLAGIAAVSLHAADLRDAQRNFFSHITDMLVTALDSHLGFHQGHGRRVAQFANRLGRALGLDDETLERVHFASLLHDIGMLKLDRNQQMTRSTCEQHCVLGSRMLTRIRLWRDLGPIVYHHHEWFDGTGYPDGLAGDAIPLESRIIALCDAVDSMTSDDSYRTPLTLDMALEEVESCSGSQFDPELAAAFLQLARDGLIEIGPPPLA
jgi:HD-GYP domain-containing protein (c-di-GMP phosphodiesterase class II)